MEELGTEIVLQPGMATDLLQSCVTEQAEELTQEVLPSPCSEAGDIEQEEEEEISPTTEVAITKEPEVPFAKPEVAYTEEPSTEEEEREESSTPRALLEPTKEEPSHPEVNRYDSLIETESVVEEEAFAAEVRDESPEMIEENFEPEPADYSEGQEAVWHEDVEHAGDADVCYVKPEKEKKMRRKMQFAFFKRGKKAQKAKPVSATTEATKEPSPVEIQNEEVEEVEQYEEAIELERIRTNFAKVSMDEDNDNEGDKEGEAYSNAIDLTDAPNTIGVADAPNDVEMAKPTDASNTVENVDASGPKELTDAPMELTESATNSIEFTSTIDLTSTIDDPQEKFVADVANYANRAMNYIESILPLPKRGSSDDESISTLGLKNDTEEYELDTATYGDETYERSKITEVGSISSLNDILDGNGSIADKKRSEVEKYAVPAEKEEVQKESEPSPPDDVEETEVAKEDVEETEVPTEEKPEDPETTTEQNDVVDLADVTPEIEEPLCVSADVPTQVNLVLDDRYDPAHVDEEKPDDERSERSDRYEMVEQQEDDVKVELTASAAKADIDDDDMSEDFNRLQSASFDQMCDDIVNGRTEMSPTNGDKYAEADKLDKYEPVEETSSRGEVELEENIDTEIDMSEKETKEEDIVLTNDEPADEKSEHEEASNEESPRDSEAPIDEEVQVTNTEENVVEMNNDETETVEKAMDENEAVEQEVVEEKAIEKEEVVESEEKSNVIEQTKRKPLVPKAVVEEEYLVDKKMKKISSGKTPTNKSSWIKKTKNKRRSLTSKRTATQKAVSEVKKNPASAPPAAFDDSSTVVNQAMSNGALKANESNLEGDEFAPTNYLKEALKKARYTDMGEAIDDEDSYVAAIRAPRTKEAPGVALVDEKKHLEPGTAGANNEVVVDLAPTPRLARKPNMFTNEQKLAEERAQAILKEREEERQRRKMITERLFNAGRSEVTKESSEDVLKTISTAPTSESYTEEPVQENAEKIEKVKPRRKLAISFLKRK